MTVPRSELFFQPGDSSGEAQFIAWHWHRHRTYDLLASGKGVTLPTLDVSGPVDADWLHRHYARHLTLRKLAGGASGAYLAGLLDVDWDDPNQLREWLKLHSFEHGRLDQYFGIH